MNGRVAVNEGSSVSVVPVSEWIGGISSGETTGSELHALRQSAESIAVRMYVLFIWM